MTPPRSWPFRLSLVNGRWVVNKPPKPAKPNLNECERNLL